MRASRACVLASQVRQAAHFYMAHRMTESVRDGISYAEHVPSDQRCPGCKAEAALVELELLADQNVARVGELERERDEARQGNAELTALGIDRELALEDLRAERAELRAAIRAALKEIGIPTNEYPAPLHNAVGILSAALVTLKIGEE